MRYGIYYAYWEKAWSADYLPYIKKVAGLGFDVLEIACTPLPDYSRRTLTELKACADEYGIALTGGHGPQARHNLASADDAVIREAMDFYTAVFEALEVLGARSIGGGLYSYWPVDFSKPMDKAADRARSIRHMRRLADLASDHGITLCLESLNRFEGYLINTAAEGAAFVDEVDKDNVRLLLDTFHMNIEEDSFEAAILTAGNRLERLHVGEANRRLPGKGRLPWDSIGRALADIGFDGDVVMEPFVKTGGQVGADIKIWRELEEDTSAARLDADAKESLAFLKAAFAR